MIFCYLMQLCICENLKEKSLTCGLSDVAISDLIYRRSAPNAWNPGHFWYTLLSGDERTEHSVSFRKVLFLSTVRSSFSVLILQHPWGERSVERQTRKSFEAERGDVERARCSCDEEGATQRETENRWLLHLIFSVDDSGPTRAFFS